jgi:hypothetical protein
MSSTPLRLLLILLAMTACRPENAPKAEAPLPPRTEILSGIPRLSSSRVQDTTGSADAEQLVMTTIWPVAHVATFYRDSLRARGWQIVSDQGDTLRTLLYARKDSLLLWADIRQLNPLITQYVLIAGTQPAAGPGPEMYRPK